VGGIGSCSISNFISAIMLASMFLSEIIMQIIGSTYRANATS